MTTLSWNYQPIRKNIYSAPVPKPDLLDIKCSCPDGPSKCSTGKCINRATFIECSETCGANCMNRRIQTNNWTPNIERILTNQKGYGIFATSVIKKGEFILEYVGEVLTQAHFEERMRNIYKNETHHYCLQLKGRLVIDGQRVGWEGRFVNHSCDPNCEMQQWLVNGMPTMALFALREIEKGEELCYDYNFVLFDESKGQACFCGSRNCRGVIGIPKKGYKQRLSVATTQEMGEAVQVQSTRTLKGKQELCLKDLSTATKNFVQEKRCFLTRNYEKVVKRRREHQANVDIWSKLEKIMAAWAARYRVGSSLNKLKHLPEVGSRFLSISQIICEFFVKISSAVDENGTVLCQPFVSFKYERNHHKHHLSSEPSSESLLDFYQIGQKITNGQYQSFSEFDDDLGTVLTYSTAVLTKENPLILENVRKIKHLVSTLKREAKGQIKYFSFHLSNSDLAVEDEVPHFKTIPVNPLVDTVIRCICERFFEEEIMVQCENCRIWQHSDCMQVPQNRKNQQRNEREINKQRVPSFNYVTAQRTSKESLSLSVREDQILLDGSVVSISEELSMIDYEDDSELTDVRMQEMDECILDMTDHQQGLIPTPEKTFSDDKKSGMNKAYYCNHCNPRSINREVPLIDGDNSDPDKIEFKTLVREDGFLISKNDVVYVARDPLHVTSLEPVVPKQCDILRVENLFIHSNGNKFVYGHCYVRPNETYHKQYRRFFKNEICLSPVNRIVPIDLIRGRCWVLDPSTYCEGRPVGCQEEHAYICEYAVDRLNRKFSKIDKIHHAVCMKPFAFHYFESKIKIKRTFSVSPLIRN